MRPKRALHSLLLLWSAPKYKTYKNAREEDRYWAAAELYGRCLQCSDVRFAELKRVGGQQIPVVTSYAPALLPCRQRRHRKCTEYHLSVRALCKWHRMVFPGPRHPSVSQASRLRERFSLEDRREIHRISRMIPDEKVFGGRERKWTPKYRDIWRKWLERDSREVNVVFAQSK
ncbi:hypothetical protein C8R43DRAFT_878323 [Mycena crocata]|nr:hypothetical protein C8R43DRAFT_878323 [Mycena crocata]